MCGVCAGYVVRWLGVWCLCWVCGEVAGCVAIWLGSCVKYVLGVW